MRRGSKQQNEAGLESRLHGPSSRTGDPEAIIFPQTLNGGSKKEKEPKRKKGRPVESAAPEKISQGRLRQYLLEDFHSCLENLAGFSTATTGPAAVTTTTELTTN